MGSSWSLKERGFWEISIIRNTPGESITLETVIHLNNELIRIRLLNNILHEY